jgi:hypothetical protein
MKHILSAEEAYTKCSNNSKRIKRFESIVATDPYCAYRYARDNIKGRWPEAERYIINDSQWTYWYAINIIKGKLPEHMHNAMILYSLSNDGWAENYFDFIKDNPQP